jgi:hypothetical protein
VVAFAIEPDIVATESAAAIPPATRIRLIIAEPPELASDVTIGNQAGGVRSHAIGWCDLARLS